MPGFFYFLSCLFLCLCVRGGEEGGDETGKKEVVVVSNLIVVVNKMIRQLEVVASK